MLVDTNVLIYAAENSSPFHGRCKEWLERQRESLEPWYVSWPILFEFLRVITHPHATRKPWNAPSAWRFVLLLLESPSVDVLLPSDRHAEIAGQLVIEFPYLAGNVFHDLHTVALMREHGIRQICTRDNDFRQFKFLSVIDPVHL